MKENATSPEPDGFAALVRGGGRFTADIDFPDQAWAAFVRSPHAHADISKLDTAGVMAMPGVLGAYTGRDLVAVGIGTMPCSAPVSDRSGCTMSVPPWFPLADGRVCHVGQAIAVVVAESAALAADAAEAFEIEFSARPAVVDGREALAPGAPRIWDDISRNLAADWEAGDRVTVEQAFERAAQVISVEVRSQRLATVPLEPRAAVALWQPDQAQFVLIAPSQGVAPLRAQLAICLGVGPDQVRVITPNVGGAFGSRTQLYPEHAALLYAARALRRPVKWIASRTDTFLAEAQGRDTQMHGRLALDETGRAMALRADVVSNLGAFATPHGAYIATHNFARCLPGVYRIPAVYVRVQCVYTNTIPVGPYRGAGRPEAALLLERLFDCAAQKRGVDRVALRRINLVTPVMIPYTAPNGCTYDSGDFPRLLDRAWTLIDGDGFDARRSAAARLGRLRGLGIGLYLEASGGASREHSAVVFDEAGRIEIAVGGQASGQGHGTAFAHLAAERLGIAMERISIRQGDTDRLGSGGSSTASRTLVAGANVIELSLQQAITAGRRLAALRLDRPEDEIEYCKGSFCDRQTGERLDFGDLVKWLQTRPNLPADAPQTLDQETSAESSPTYPNGCHMCEVEIDPDTGAVVLVDYVAVDDIGKVYSPRHAEAQIHGAIVQGLGQVMRELVRYDPESGQILTASFLDYAMPRAQDLVTFRTEFVEIPCRTNSLGAKGAGEAGVAGAIAAAYNGLLHALAPAGISELEMPATSHAVWQALARHARAEGRG